MSVNAEILKNALKKAKESLPKAHAPYSGLQVACALKLEGVDGLVMGVNVENASFGGTICAERSAIVSAISQYGKKKIEFVVVISTFKGAAIPPCGMCLQVLSEFVDEDCPIYLGGVDSLDQGRPFKDFLPLAFKAESLPGHS